MNRLLVSTISLVVLTSTLLTACGDSFSPEGVSGFYELESINGDPIPFSETITFDGQSITTSITAGSVSLNENSTYSMSLTFQIEGGGTTISDTETDSGTYTLVEPASVRFTNSEGDTFAGTKDGDRLTLIEEGMTFVFRK